MHQSRARPLRWTDALARVQHAAHYVRSRRAAIASGGLAPVFLRPERHAGGLAGIRQRDLPCVHTGVAVIRECDVDAVDDAFQVHHADTLAPLARGVLSHSATLFRAELKRNLPAGTRNSHRYRVPVRRARQGFSSPAYNAPCISFHRLNGPSSQTTLAAASQREPSRTIRRTSSSQTTTQS